MDRRWPLVLDGLDAETPPCSTGPLVALRQRVIAQQLDRRLLARTVARAARRGACGPRQLRAALASRPRWGAGRVEEPDTLVGHALRKALSVLARQQGRGLRAVAEEAGASLVAGPSLPAAVDVDWDAPRAQQHALPLLLDTLSAVAHGLETPPAPAATASQGAATRTVAQPGQAQDSVTTPEGPPTLRHGVAAERRLSVEEAERRHGRKRRRLLGDGDKRPVLRALDSRLLVAVDSTPAHAPEASVPAASAMDLAAQQCTRRAWPMDRASLASPRGQPRTETWAMFCQAGPVRQGPYLPTRAFQLAGERYELRGPGGATMPFAPGGVGKCPAAPCGPGVLRERCTASASGRRGSRHPEEALWQELRERPQTAQGRAPLRARVAVEHALAHVGRWQGRRARYRGVRKKGFDLRRCAVVHNLHVLIHLPQIGQAA